MFLIIIIMTGGILQLVAEGINNIFLTKNPQITFFKIVYRRHTNFSMECIPQYFTHNPDFGKKVTSIISKAGDLIQNIILVLKLPFIPKFTNSNGDIDDITKFAWVKKIGFAIIKSIEIEIGGQIIDKHYGEWMNIVYELFEQKVIDKMIGNIKELYDYTNGKKEYILHIPLYFWFCKTNTLALPIIALKHNDVKINLEINEFIYCYTISPTHYIQVYQNIVNLQDNEYITQNINNNINVAQFCYFDLLTNNMYYRKITRSSFQTIMDSTLTTSTLINNAINLKENSKYYIIGDSSSFSVMPCVNTNETVYLYNKLKNIHIESGYLLVNYIYLDNNERIFFSQNKNDYLIEQVISLPENKIEGINRTIRMDFNHPVKYIVWVLQQVYLRDTNNNDIFNFTDSYNNKIGNNISDMSTILLNGHERISFRNSIYFNWIQNFQFMQNMSSEGINLYCFSLYPNKTQPSGSCNMSKIDNILLQIRVKNIINFNNQVKVRIYAVNNNILRIVNGLSGLVFYN